jgi:hypothetical protein
VEVKNKILDHRVGVGERVSFGDVDGLSGEIAGKVRSTYRMKEVHLQLSIVTLAPR